MELRRIKPYKTRKPEDTIFLIRTILHEKLGLLMKEEHIHGDNQFYSCRICIANKSLIDLNIGTNGKGMKFEYALASAYGELMERLQNQILILHRNVGYMDEQKKKKFPSFYQELKKKNILLKYCFAPDERNILFDKSGNVIRKYIKSSNIDELESFYQGKRLNLVPFYNVFEQKVEELPINIIFSNCTSNGMCAGNTPHEALIQGMSEILERYIIRKIYYENLTFPTIPDECFEGTDIYQKIELIAKKYHWIFEIKDCSCGVGIPAIGILIIDKQKQSYKFHLGVDPSPITALERTLTEIYQGKMKIELQEIDWKLQNELLYEEELKAHEMFQTCTVGRGQYPISLLQGSPSYQFKGFDSMWGISDYNDIQLLLSVFRKMNRTVFVRDVSFLGFPAYFIYVPGMSESRDIVNNNHLKEITLLQQIYDGSRDLISADSKTINNIITYIVNTERGTSNLQFYNLNDFWLYYDKNLILSLLSCYIGENEEALKYMNNYISRSDLPDVEKNFFSCIAKLLEKKENRKDEVLQRLYGAEMVRTCRHFLENKIFFKFMNYSQCYNCQECKIQSTCKIFDSLSLLKEIENVYVANIPNQYSLQLIFNFDVQ